MRKKIAEDGYCSLSFNLNIPGYPKSNDDTTGFFSLVLGKFKRYLMAHRILLKNELCEIDEAGDFFLAAIHSADQKIEDIKEICERFEMNHDLGRLLDIDITDIDNKPVSSGKQKLCFYCNEQPAIQCMREQRHDYDELRDYAFKEMKKYIEKSERSAICKELSAFAVRSILYEISLTPKPGLVDKNNNGSHTDMNYTSFINSTSEISVFFNELAQAGFDFRNDDYQQVLPIIRRIGLEMEEKMFESTSKVNTQKGLIFLMGMAIFSASQVIARNKRFDLDEFKNMVIDINKGILSELKVDQNSPLTHGEYCAEKFGEIATGARGEVYKGFPTVIDYGIKELLKFSYKEVLFNEEIHNKALTNTLLIIMSQNNDTNIIYRGGMEALKTVKDLSAKVLMEDTDEQRNKNYQKLIAYCDSAQVSPGGAADLLAVTIFVYLVFQKF